MDTGIANLIAEPSDERWEHMETVAAQVVEEYGGGDIEVDLLITVTCIVAMIEGLQAMRWEAEKAVTSALAAQACSDI
jgi:hypothetical protein